MNFQISNKRIRLEETPERETPSDATLNMGAWDKIMSTKTRSTAFAKPKRGRPAIEKPEAPQTAAAEQPESFVLAPLEQQKETAPETPVTETSPDINML